METMRNLAHQRGCGRMLLHQERLSPEQGMVQDILQDMRTIVRCFSARLDGSRNHRCQLDAARNKDIKHVAGTSHQA